MSVKFAVLGLLSRKPSTGYELKKMFEESTFLYWSGNNNQIYKALIELQAEELVTSERIHQERSPSKKVYTITDTGRAALKDWVLSSPEAPELKKPFLVQLAWSDLLTDQELDQLLSAYELELQDRFVMHQELSRRALQAPNRNTRESLLREMVTDNISSTYQNELNWVRETRQKLLEVKLMEDREHELSDS